MELAIILILLVIVELVVTVWLLARTLYGNRKYGTLDKRMNELTARVAKLELEANDTVDAAANQQPTFDATQQQQAIDLLAKLGIGVESSGE